MAEGAIASAPFFDPLDAQTYMRLLASPGGLADRVLAGYRGYPAALPVAAGHHVTPSMHEAVGRSLLTISALHQVDGPAGQTPFAEIAAAREQRR